MVVEIDSDSDLDKGTCTYKLVGHKYISRLSKGFTGRQPRTATHIRSNSIDDGGGTPHKYRHVVNIHQLDLGRHTVDGSNP